MSKVFNCRLSDVRCWLRSAYVKWGGGYYVNNKTDYFRFNLCFRWHRVNIVW